MDELELKEKYFIRAEELVLRLDKLHIIYLRVSTKGMGQEEMDQLKDILNTFNLDLKDCILIKAKESAYQLWKQKTRKFNIIKDLIEEYPEYDKIIYVWDLDRIYRNQEMQVEFFRYVSKNNGMVLSHRQKYLHQLKESAGGLGKAMYNFLIEVFAAQAEDESRKRGERLLKSLTAREGRLFTNKGNLYGGKLKTIKGKKITDPKVVDSIHKVVVSKIIKGVTYRDIIKYMETKNVKVSMGFLNNMKKKYL